MEQKRLSILIKSWFQVGIWFANQRTNAYGVFYYILIGTKETVVKVNHIAPAEVNAREELSGGEATHHVEELKKPVTDLQHDSSLDMDEGPVKEEMMSVSTGGVRKLKFPPEPGDLGDDHERKGLVLQESFEDELPYVPTTLPLER